MTRRTFRVFTRFLRPHRKRLAALLVLTSIISVLSMLPPLLVRGVVDHVITRGAHDLFFVLAVFLLLLPVLHAFCSMLQLLGIALVGQRFIMDLRCATYRKMLSLSLRFHSKHSVGKLVNRLMGDTGQIQQVVTVQTIQVVSDFLCAVFAVSVAFALNWRLAVLLVIVVVLFVTNYRLNAARIRRATRGYRGAEDRLAGGIQNRLVADLTVKTFGAEQREQGIFRGQLDTTMDLVQESEEATRRFSMNTLLLRDVGRAVVYFCGCVLVLRDTASYGDVVAFTAYTMQLLVPAVRFSTLAQQLQDVGVSMDRVCEILEQEPELEQRPRRVTAARGAGRVEFDAVDFHYEPGQPVLKAFDLHVAPGQTVALVGPTGCGKTTVLSLLLRFYDVIGGAIRLDGVDLRDLDLHALRGRFGIVLQEPLLFDVTVAQNIAYSSRNAGMAQIEAAARVAEIHDFIGTLPEGYDTLLGSRGTQLSIGQKQRLNIARAVLANPALIIMDEATSALDSDSERAIQVAMNRFLAGRTSFIVAHRLSTIRNADRIVVLRAGEIHEAGSHEDLMRIEGGHYRGLYEAHAGRGTIEG